MCRVVPYFRLHPFYFLKQQFNHILDQNLKLNRKKHFRIGYPFVSHMSCVLTMIGRYPVAYHVKLHMQKFSALWPFRTQGDLPFV